MEFLVSVSLPSSYTFKLDCNMAVMRMLKISKTFHIHFPKRVLCNR